MKYRVIDDYDCTDEIIGEYNTPKEVKKAINERIDDTDGECYIIVKELDDFGVYMPVSLKKFGFCDN